MLKLVACRAVNGISLNGKEYLLDDDGKVRVFDTVEEILALLDVESVEDLEARGIDMEERECT